MASVTTSMPHQQPQQQQPMANDYDYSHESRSQYNQQPQQPQQSQPPPQQHQLQATNQSIPQFQPYLVPDQDAVKLDNNSNNPQAYAQDSYSTGKQTADDQPYTSFANPDSTTGQTTQGLNMKYQLFLDQITPHWRARWAFSLTALLVFMARVVLSQGWYVVCYALAIYYLNLFIGFISPKIDPSLNFNDDEDGPMLPTHASDEFKPFIRRLPEFKFWLSATQATLISLFLTLFEIFDIPVFWPILLLYFIILTACTLRQQIKHMIKWKYVPWNAGKKQYTGKSSQGSDYDPTTV